MKRGGGNEDTLWGKTSLTSEFKMGRGDKEHEELRFTPKYFA